MILRKHAQEPHPSGSPQPRAPFVYRPRKGLARPGTPLWRRSKDKWTPKERWDFPLIALARRFASSPRAPLTKCERAIMSELADKCDRKLKYAFCGLALLMRVTKYSRRGIQKALKNLEKKGFLVIDRSQTQYRTSKYHLMFDAMENALSSTPVAPADALKKRVDLVAKNQKVHPNISKYINILPTLRSPQNAFEKFQAKAYTLNAPSLPVSPDGDDIRYKKVVERIQQAILRHGGSQRDLLSTYYELSASSTFDDELKENLHRSEHLLVTAVLSLLMQIRGATSYISGTLTDTINALDRSNGIRA